MSQTNTMNSPNRITFSKSTDPCCLKDATTQDVRWCTPKRYSPSKLRQLRDIGQLDPSLYMNEETEDLYDQAPGHVGRLWFVLNYKKSIEQLTVCIIKARNLRVIKEINCGQVGDCYVKIFLESDERRVHTTTCKRKTNNPTFRETFCFQIPQFEITEQCLKMPVYHIDRQKRQKLIGIANYSLKDLLSYDKDMRIFRDLQMDSEKNNTPEIRIGLTLHIKQLTEKRITVGLFQVLNLPLRSDSHIVEVYAKVSLLMGLQGKEIKCKRSEIINHVSNNFNESFTFKTLDLEQTAIRVTLMQHNSTIGTLLDKPIGSVVLGSELFAKRQELLHWNEMCMNPEEQVAYSHNIVHF